MPNKPATTQQRKQYRDRAAELAAHTAGSKVDRCYIVRNMLIAELHISMSYAVRLAQEAISNEPPAQRHISAARDTVAALEQERSEIVNAEATARARQAARESIAAHVVRLRSALENSAFEMWRELVEVLDIKSRLVQIDAGRAVRLSCAIAEDAVIIL